MIPLDYALAAALLITPPDHPDLVYEYGHLTTIIPALRTVARQQEVMDEREVPYILARPDSFASDINFLRKRWQELIDAPPDHDAMRFPCRDLVKDLKQFNRDYRQRLHDMLKFKPINEQAIIEAIAETDQLYNLWDLVTDARCDYYYITVRRTALKKIKEAIGDEAYYSGQLPPHVPLWRFCQAD